MKTDELRALLAAATPGEWELDDAGTQVIVDTRALECCGRGNQNGCCGEPVVTGDYGPIAAADEANAALIVAMRNELPALLDRLDAAEKDAARYRFLRANGREIVFGFYPEAVTSYSGLDDPHDNLDAAIDQATASERGGCDG